MLLGNMNMPMTYGMENVYNSRRHPSAMHAEQSGLSRYYQRYLIQKIMSVFEWKNLPEHWSVDYFMYSLYVWGYVAIIKTDKYGIIPQWCTLSGRDVFYRPTTAVISNPLLQGNLTPRIGIDCGLIKMQPDYGGAWDIVSYYADLLALSAQTAAVNIVNSKLSFIATAGTKQAAESLKKMFDKLASGEIAAIVDSDLYTEQGRPLFELFVQNLKANYIAGDILEDMAKLDSRFCTEIGIPNVNIAKESGVGDSEIQANNFDTRSKASVWLETMKKGVDEVNRLFNLNIEVNFREVDNAQKPDIDTRALSI